MPDECAMLEHTDKFVGVEGVGDDDIVYNPVMERRLNHKVKADKLSLKI